MIPEHQAIHWELKFKEACDQREPRVGALTSVADDLLKAVPKADNRHACIMGALLQVYEMGAKTCRDTLNSDRQAQLDGLSAQLQRVLADIVGKTFAGAKVGIRP